MIEPTGPLDPSVYWRRRVVALCGSVLVVVLLAVVVSAWLGSGSSADPQGVANKQSVVATSSKRLTSSPPTSGTITPAGASSSSSASPAPAPTTTTTGPPPPPPPPGPCPDTAITVEARIAQPSYRVGQSPLLTIAVVNSGPVACNREVTRQLRELVVSTADGATRLWSSSDCYYQQPADTRLLQPGEQATFSIAWSGRTSAPNCAPSGALLPAGDYAVTAKLGALASRPTPFKLT